MRRRLAFLVAPLVAVGMVLAAATTGAESCEPGVDDARMLTPSTRLDGAVEALRRDGVVVLVRTAATGKSASAYAVDVAARCPDLGHPDADAVLVVVGASNRDVDVLPIGSTRPQDALLAHDMIAGRLDRGDPDVTSAVAQGLEALWQARASGGATEDDPPPSTENRWVRARTRRIATAALGAGAATALAVLLVTVGQCRRRRVADAFAEAQRCRTALAERYVDLDVAVIGAAAAQQRAGAKVPRSAAEALAAAGHRATTALLATAESPPRHLADAQAVAATCRAAEQALREAVDAIGGTRGL